MDRGFNSDRDQSVVRGARMRIAITGGGGYVGSSLVPQLIKRGNTVSVLDTFWFGDYLEPHSRLKKIKGDIRNPHDLKRAFNGVDAVIHLACVSNDPSFEMNPGLGKSINYDSFKGIVDAAKEANVKKFIYASSSSVYGVNTNANITEDTPCNPLTDYSKFKLACEAQLKSFGVGDAEWTIIRPATVCGYAPRLRLDVVVNLMTAHALFKKKITVFGGLQLRPNINIKDMVRAYVHVLNSDKAHGKTYNVGYENLQLMEIAEKVQRALPERNIKIEVKESSDPRSYHVNSDLIADELGFTPENNVTSAISSLDSAFRLKLIRGSETESKYINITRMKELIDAGEVQLPPQTVCQPGADL